MPGKLLLIADDAQRQRLQAESDLCPSWWNDLAAGDPLAGIQQTPPWILSCRPELLGEESPLSQSDRTELINFLLDTTVCYLAVVDARSYENPVAAGDRVDSQLPAATAGLAEHAAWYEAFLGDVQRRARSRSAHLRHVLILVCLDDPPNEQLGEFRRLAVGSQRQRLFDVSYVMLQELEPGQEGGQFFQATHVWPIAVGDLLLKLLHDDSKPQGGPTRARAWRCYHLNTAVDDRELDQVGSSHFFQLRDQLFSDLTQGTRRETSPFTRFEPLGAQLERSELAAPDEDDYARRSWLESSAIERHREVSSESRWQRSLDAAGAEVGRQLSRRSIAEEPAVFRQLQHIWKSAHQDPRFIFRALADHDLIRGPILVDQFAEMNQRWKEILERDRQRGKRIEEARGCGKHLDAARDHHVNLPYRLLAIFVVTLFVGYVSISLLHFLTGSIGPGIAVALAGIVGAGVAGLLSLDREGAAGRRAKRVFERYLDGIDEAVRERHDCCQSAVETADKFCQRTWGRAAAAQLRQSLRRVQVMLERELVYRPEGGHEVRAETKDHALAEPQDPQREPEDRGRARQQSRYRELARLSRAVELDVLQRSENSDALEDFVRKQAEQFRDEIWAPFCELHDHRQFTGNLPARLFIPLLRKFRDRFHVELLNRIRRTATRSLRPDQFGLWGDQIEQIVEFQHFFELASCRLLGHQLAGEQPGWPMIYLRQGMQVRQFVPHVTTPRLPREAIPAPYLRDLPTLGFLFQELPVDFVSGPAGKITVGHRPLGREDRDQADEA